MSLSSAGCPLRTDHPFLEWASAYFSTRIGTSQLLKRWSSNLKSFLLMSVDRGKTRYLWGSSMLCGWNDFLTKYPDSRTSSCRNGSCQCKCMVLLLIERVYWDEKTPFGKLKKNQGNKIEVIIDEALAISQRYNNLLKKQYWRLWRPHDGFCWFHGAGGSNIWNILNFIVVLKKNSRGMASMSLVYGKTSALSTDDACVVPGRRVPHPDATSIDFID